MNALRQFSRRLAPAASRHLSPAAIVHRRNLIKAPPMVYISGEEMTRYCMELIMKQWITPNLDTSSWEFYDMSCKSRDDTADKVLRDAVSAGARIGAIFKEPTVTPSEAQRQKWGLKHALGSPNGAMRRGWNGITISRDTIHVEGIELGFKRPVLFERQAVGGEYGAGYKMVSGDGVVETVFRPADGSPETVVDTREIEGDNGVVLYHNPLDQVPDLAHIFFERCLLHNCTPYVVTKKTVFKWQEGFWQRMKQVFDAHYLDKFLAAGLLDNCGGQLQHLISDAATMQAGLMSTQASHRRHHTTHDTLHTSTRHTTPQHTTTQHHTHTTLHHTTRALIR